MLITNNTHRKRKKQTVTQIIQLIYNNTELRKTNKTGLTKSSFNK